jgi:hypothetical protein
VEIDLSTLEPHINGPFTPDLATPLSQFKAAAAGRGFFLFQIGLFLRVFAVIISSVIFSSSPLNSRQLA